VVRDPDGKAELQRIIVGAEERKSKDGTPYTLVRYLTPDGQPPGSLPTVSPTNPHRLVFLRVSTATAISPPSALRV
jgi:hypothetical protein